MSADQARQANLLAVVALGLTDALTDRLADGSPVDAMASTGLVAMLDFTPRGSIRDLSRVLGLTHSGTVRLVNRLAEEGLVTRAPGSDARTTLVELTRPGRTLARRLRRDRAEVSEHVLAELTPRQRDELARACETIVAALVEDRLARRDAGTPPAAGALCRWCDFTACGRPDGHCPAATTAARHHPTD